MGKVQELVKKYPSTCVYLLAYISIVVTILLVKVM